MASEAPPRKLAKTGGKSSYTIIDGTKYDRELLAAVEKFAADGQVGYPEAKQLWKHVEHDSGATDIARATMEYAMRAYRFSEKASSFLKTYLSCGIDTSPYKIIDGIKYDRQLLESAMKFVADGQISWDEAKQLFDDAYDGERITATKRNTIEYVLEKMTFTDKARKWLTSALETDSTSDGVKCDAALSHNDNNIAECSVISETSLDGNGAAQLEQGLEKKPSLVFQQNFTFEKTGDINDSYSLDPPEKTLGEGSYGSVVRAIEKSGGAVRAVKQINLRKFQDGVEVPAFSEDRLRKFQEEVNIAKQLDHPNVVRLYEVFNDGRRLYLVMELCTGRELFDRISEEARKGFDEFTAAKYIRQMLAAVCYLHSQGFAHRDVKPENFLLQNAEPNAALKIIDFGFACKCQQGVSLSSKVGTPYYVAPEVLRGDYNEKCDIWSTGVISFILLCGSPPFAGNNDRETLKKVQAGKYKWPPWATVGKDGRDFIDRMLTFDIGLRPHAAALLMDAWLEQKGPRKAAPVPDGFIERLTSFRVHCKFKKIALAVVAQQLPSDDLESLRNTFLALDENGDGMLSVEEIRKGILQAGCKLPVDLEAILRTVDLNASGSLDYTEFIAATMDQKLYRKRDICWNAFRIFDLDGDGKITAEELQKVLNMDGVQAALGVEKVQSMIHEVDRDGDGCIDFDEFIAMMEMSPMADMSPLATGAKRRRVSSPCRRRLVGKQHIASS